MKDPTDLDIWTGEQERITSTMGVKDMEREIRVPCSMAITGMLSTAQQIPVSFWQRFAYETHERAKRDADVPTRQLQAEMAWIAMEFLQKINECADKHRDAVKAEMASEPKFEFGG